MNIKLRTVVAASAVAMITLAGCSQATENTDAGGGTGSEAGGGEALAADTIDINEMPADQVGQGGTLRLANNAYPANWNTFSLDGNEANTSEMMETMWPVLLRSDPQGNVSPNEQFAQRIELVSEDPMVMEIELNEGMTWSDGTPIDWTSVENAFTVLSGQDEAYTIASSEGYDQVESVEQGDNPQTAVITFAEPYADWIGLAAVMPDALADDPEMFNSGWVDGPQVTAGPFEPGTLDPTNKTVTVVPNADWWGETPKLDQILWTTIEDPAAAATAYQNGQLDALETAVPATYTVVEDMIGNGSELRMAAGPDWTHLTLNGAEGRAMDDPLVRQAVFNAIDREEVFLSVNAAMPYPENTEQLNNRIIMTNQEGYEDTSGEFGQYDPDMARQKLEEAGYTFDESGLATMDGQPLTITYVYNDGSQTNEAVIPVVQENLAEVGITMEVQNVPPTDLFAEYVIPGEYDITLFGWNGTPFLSSGDAIWTTDGESNFSNVGDPAIDEALDQASRETDMQTRIDLYNEADANLWEVAGVLPLWQAYMFMVQDEDLANYGAFGFVDTASTSPDWTTVGFVEGADNLG